MKAEKIQSTAGQRSGRKSSKEWEPKIRGGGPYLSALVYGNTSCYHLVIPGLQKETLVWYGILKSERVGELKGQAVNIFNMSTTLDWDTYKVQRIDRKSFLFLNLRTT